jgi:hypothetical protein
MYWNYPTKIVLASDTLVVAADASPLNYSTKIFPLPHLQGVMPGAGKLKYEIQMLAVNG